MIMLFLRFETGFPPAHHQQQILATPTPLEVIKIFFTDLRSCSVFIMTSLLEREGWVPTKRHQLSSLSNVALMIISKYL